MKKNTSKDDNRCNQRLNGRALEIYQRLKHEPRGVRSRLVNRGIELAYDEMQGHSQDDLHRKIDRLIEMLASLSQQGIQVNIDPPGHYSTNDGIPDELGL